jgi:holo-[acyl-carrier protein] synthase
MTILGIGVDVLHLPRLSRHLSDNRLARRILSPAELRDYLALPKEENGKRIRFLGVRCAPLLCSVDPCPVSQSTRRWAVKEAAYKAVYPALKPTWKEFRLRKVAGRPKPDLVYHPKDNLLSLKLGRIHTSVSHDQDYVFATVVVEQPAQI